MVTVEIAAYYQGEGQTVLKAVGAEAHAAITWDVLGATIHYDGTVPHINLHISKVTADHMLANPSRLRTIGSWSVAQWRLANIGVRGPGNSVLADNLRRFRERHGAEAEPLDLRLHRALDEAFGKRGAGGGGESISDMTLLRTCEAAHRSWKLRQPKPTMPRAHRYDRIMLAVFDKLAPFLPRELMTAMKFVTQISQLIRVVDDFVKERRNRQCQLTKESNGLDVPSVNAPPIFPRHPPH